MRENADQNNSEYGHFSRMSLARDRTKCLFLNDERCVIRPTLIDMNPVELKYYPFMISLNKCTGCCHVLFSKICVPKEAKDIHVKAFNMIADKYEVKTMAKNISCDCISHVFVRIVFSCTKQLWKLPQECAFSIDNRLIKQINGCPMGGPISVVFSDIDVCKIVEDIVIPENPIFYKRYVDDT